MSWQDKIRNPNCTLCPLHEDAGHVCLMGSGLKKAKVMIVGEAPGAREDEAHAAFVGPAGELLTELLEEVGLSRDEVYITNAVKCRPPENRTPDRSEVKACSGYLLQELEKVRPTHILSLGNTALQALTGRSGITKHRGRVYPVGVLNGPTAECLPTFHPAAGLRNPSYLPSIRSDFSAFTRLLRGTRTESKPTRVRLARTPSQVNWLCQQLEKAEVISFDLETTGLSEHEDGAKIVTAGFSWEPGSAVVVPLFHKDSQSDYAGVLRQLGRVLRAKRLVAHNGKFDARWLAASGVFVDVDFDTMIAAHILDENRPKGLKPLSQLLLGVDEYDIGDDVKDAYNAPLKKLCIYNGKDCDYTLRLYYIFREQLKEEPRKARVFKKLMMPASNALTRIERGGMWVDRERLRERTEQAEANLKKIQNYMLQYVPKDKQDINFNSHPQVAMWLFSDLKLPIVERTGTGAPSSKESVLLHLAHKHKAVAALLKYRKWHKHLTTYLWAWEEQLDGSSRLHTSYRPTGTVTGRLSSAGPNLQQVPRDNFIRSIIGAPPGWVFAEADYSQIELRIAAMLANETTMLRILASGEDMHLNTAARITRKRPQDITKDERVVWGKHPNFGLLFGMGPGKPGHKGGYVDYCRENGIEVSYAEAQQVYDRFHKAYPRLRMWHNRQRRLAERHRRVQSPIGRVRHLPDMLSQDKAVRAEAERQAINSPVQSLASDLCLLSLVRLDQTLDNRVARTVGTAHDALLFEVRETHVETVVPIIHSTMEDMAYVKKVFGAEINVPIRVDVEVGQHWGEGEPWKG